MEAVPCETRLRQDRIWARTQIDSFFELGGPYQTLEHLTRWLEATGSPYAIGGGVAVGEHGVDRQFARVELLVMQQGLAAIRDRGWA